MTHGPAGGPDPGVAVRGLDTCCENATVTTAATPDERWLRSARYARWLAAEGVLGLVAGFAAGSIALVGWALGSAIEALASVIVVWRFTGSRMLSGTADRRAHKAVAVSFWLLAGFKIIAAGLKQCAQHGNATAGADRAQLERLFLSLA